MSMKTPRAVAMDSFNPALTPRQNATAAVEDDRAQIVAAFEAIGLQESDEWDATERILPAVLKLVDELKGAGE